MGRIAAAAPRGDGVRLRIEAPDLGMEDVGLGDSIAVQGVCLTVVARHAQGFEADVSQATLAVTHGLESGREVNLEKALRLSDRLDGHLVSGHVDGRGEVTRKDQVGESWLLEVRLPAGLVRYVARKGSITVNGVSLTVNRVQADRFEVNLIPHTLEMTNLGVLRPGARVNLEVDMLARYLERLLTASS